MIRLSEQDLHPHLKARMLQRGVTISELETALNQGWEAIDAKPGTIGKVFVFPYGQTWEGKMFEEKEVSVYYKYVNDTLLILTAKARYGKGFSRKKENI